MAKFRTRIKQISKEKGRIILANDYDDSVTKLQSKTIKNIKTLHKHICGIKLNFHLLIPLGIKEITKINKIAHQHNLQTIADIKLNDISNTNKITTEILWKMGFDAVIVNPIMGFDSLKNLVKSAHKKERGVITLCHMSAPEAKLSYELGVKSSKTEKKLYHLFLEWALSSKADGIIVGATFPEIIKFCKKKTSGKLDIYSPGVGVQGGNAKNVLANGTDYLIIGRTILNAKNPLDAVKKIQSSIT